MRAATQRSDAAVGEAPQMMDWSSLGRAVRVRSMQAVALHFAEIAVTRESGGQIRRAVVQPDRDPS